MTFLRLFCILLLCAGAVILFRQLSKKLPQKLSKSRAEQVLLLLSGLTPLFAGLLMDGIVTTFPFVALPFRILSAAALIGWAIVSRRWCEKGHSILRVILLQHLIPALFFLLLAIQLLGAHHFWAGLPGFLTQEFFLPVINLGFWITSAAATTSFPGYCVAFLLLPVSSLMGCLWKRPPSTPRLQPYFVRRIALVLAGLWLISMALLTVGTAQYVLDELVESGYDFPEYVGMSGGLDEYYPTEERMALGETREHRPGGADYCMLNGITRTTLYNGPPTLSYYPDESWFGGIYRDRWNNLNTAVLFMDNEENILHQNGDFLYFYYQTADSWAAQEEDIDGYAWVDLSDEEDPRYAMLRSQYVGLGIIDLMYEYEAIRMTGYFDGSRFEPLSMALLDYDNYHFALEAASRLPYDSTAGLHAGQSYPVSWLDAWGLIEWDERYDHAADAPADKALVTIYATHLEMRLHDSIPVRYQGQVYDDLVTLLGEMGYYRDKGSYTFHQGASQISLWNTVVFGARTYWDFSDYDFTSDEPWPDAELTMLTAVQASPLLLAAGYLRNIYLVTAALVLAAFFWLRSLVKKHVAQPLSELNSGMADGWVHLPTLRRQSAELAELQTLTDHYHANQKTLHFHKNEIARLTAALRYAETAEDNRRQMTSHIAHELKTPLAVIHSYTEGLQEHIAEEKRDKYLEVILSETERMDAMVLEMLDLSRLEAGRVKLSRDEFSLQALCRSVFDKLELALQAKALQVTYTCFCDDTVTADEGRIRQVLENFATNAIKHTPYGGEIRIRVLRDSSGTTFSMENDGENLPTEVLDKVWDSFWRKDESRSSPGTGLGLAICKGIITLHGGTCAAYNTKRGVEFRFRI